MIKKVFILIAFMMLLSCGGMNEDAPDTEFFKKRNMEKISTHEMTEEIHDSSAAAGEYVYVPVYSSIYFRDSTKVYNLTVTLGIRNIDTDNEIFIKEINYNNSQGINVKKFLGRPVRVKPLETFDLVIAEDDTTGGIGANFIVKWVAKAPVQSPIIEAVMISIRQGVGLSFIETGKVLKKIH